MPRRAFDVHGPFFGIIQPWSEAGALVSVPRRAFDVHGLVKSGAEQWLGILVTFQCPEEHSMSISDRLMSNSGVEEAIKLLGFSAPKSIRCPQTQKSRVVSGRSGRAIYSFSAPKSIRCPQTQKTNTTPRTASRKFQCPEEHSMSTDASARSASANCSQAFQCPEEHSMSTDDTNLEWGCKILSEVSVPRRAFDVHRPSRRPMICSNSSF